jgi:hypothetical protein
MGSMFRQEHGFTITELMIAIQSQKQGRSVQASSLSSTSQRKQNELIHFYLGRKKGPRNSGPRWSEGEKTLAKRINL